MKTFLVGVLLVVLCVSIGQGQIIRSDSTKYVPATAWDSVWVGAGTMARNVWVYVNHLSGNSVFAVAVENDTSVAGKKRIYFYPNNGGQWVPIGRARYLRARAISGDSVHAQRTYIVQ